MIKRWIGWPTATRGVGTGSLMLGVGPTWNLANELVGWHADLRLGRLALTLRWYYRRPRKP